MAVGLFTLMVWQAVEATIGREEPGRDGRTAAAAGLSRPGRRLPGARSAGRRGCHGAGSIGLGQRRGDDVSAKLMALPFGRVLVAAVGVVVIGIGISQIVKGVKQNFTEDLDRGVRARLRRLGTVGYCAKGIALGIIGGLFVWAAVTYDPDKAGGMDAALSTIRDQPFGSVLLAIMAAGLACFGVYCFFWAEHGALLTLELAAQLRRRLDQPRISDQLPQLIMINLVQVHEYGRVSVVVRRREVGVGA